MSYEYCPYILDTETTGLDIINSEIIELSIYRLTTDEQKTWFIKANNIEHISHEALRINGHKFEDITWKSNVGKEKYLEPKDAIIDIENWLESDNLPSEKRIFVAFNVAFDYPRMQLLWRRNESEDSFPFGRRSLDPMGIAFFQDWATKNLAEGYSLNNLTKRFKIKNEKAHSAEADTKATAELFKAQLNEYMSYVTNGNKSLISDYDNLKNKLSDIKSLVDNFSEENLIKIKELLK